jgi:hypothetical protein
MIEAHENMVAGGKRPAIWLVSSPAFTKMLSESGALPTAPLLGLPVREVVNWSFGWELLDVHRARARGVQVD